MEARFRTEKEIEYWLESETRSVTMPDGSLRPISDFRLLWSHVDFLIEAGVFTEQRLVELSQQSSKETGRSFEESFVEVVSCAVQAARKYLN